MKKVTLLCLVLSGAIFLSACGYSRQINEMAYVVGLGIDKGEEKDILLSLQFAKPLAINGGASGGEEKEEKKNQENPATSLVSAEGEDIFSAMRVLESSLSKQINLTHTKVLIFSEEIAAAGVLKYAESLMGNNQFRPNTNACVSRNGAKKYFEEVKPVLEQNPAKYYTLMFSKDTKTVVPEATLMDLYLNISGGGKSAVLPVLGVLNEDNEEGKTGENKAETGGMAVFDGDRLKAVLSPADAECYNILTGGFREGYYDIDFDGEKSCVRLKICKKPGIKMNISDGILRAEIKISADSDPVSFRGTPDELQKALKEDLKKRIEGFIIKNKEIMCDCVGFGNALKKNFLTQNEWENFNYSEKFPSLSADVNIKIKVGSGLIKK